MKFASKGSGRPAQICQASPRCCLWCWCWVESAWVVGGGIMYWAALGCDVSPNHPMHSLSCRDIAHARFVFCCWFGGRSGRWVWRVQECARAKRLAQETLRNTQVDSRTPPPKRSNKNSHAASNLNFKGPGRHTQQPPHKPVGCDASPNHPTHSPCCG